MEGKALSGRAPALPNRKRDGPAVRDSGDDATGARDEHEQFLKTVEYPVGIPPYGRHLTPL